MRHLKSKNLLFVSISFSDLSENTYKKIALYKKCTNGAFILKDQTEHFTIVLRLLLSPIFNRGPILYGVRVIID